jgi:hypothetical protein
MQIIDSFNLKIITKILAQIVNEQNCKLRGFLPFLVSMQRKEAVQGREPGEAEWRYGSERDK